MRDSIDAFDRECVRAALNSPRIDTSRRIARAIQVALEPDGLMVFQLNGRAAGQSVFHYHMHLMPRNQGEPLALHTREQGDPARLREVSERLAAALVE